VLGHDFESLTSALHYQSLAISNIPRRVGQRALGGNVEMVAYQENDVVNLQNANGDTVTVIRHRMLRDGNCWNRCVGKVKELVGHSIPLTTKNLTTVGFGANLIVRYRQAQRSQKRKRDECVDFATLTDRAGRPHLVATKPTLRDGNNDTRIAAIMNELVSLGIEPTQRKLRKLRISARSLTLFQEHK
jgi:hypothetical protein